MKTKRLLGIVISAVLSAGCFAGFTAYADEMPESYDGVCRYNNVYTGGLVGSTTGGKIYGYNTGNVKKGELPSVGGLVGSATGDDIIGYNEGKVKEGKLPSESDLHEKPDGKELIGFKFVDNEEKNNVEPVPQGDGGGGSYDYDYSYGGGDSGGGIAFFSSGGGGNCVPISPLPDATKGKATTGSQGVKILEGQNLTLTDENLKKAFDVAQNQLKTDKRFSKFSLLLVSTEQKPTDGNVKLKLNDTYKNKVAYVYFVNSNGNIVKINPNSDKDYVSYTLDSEHFANNVLQIKFGNQAGTFMIVFGSNGGYAASVFGEGKVSTVIILSSVVLAALLCTSIYARKIKTE